jgi:hypothetical protein
MDALKFTPDLYLVSNTLKFIIEQDGLGYYDGFLPASEGSLKITVPRE